MLPHTPYTHIYIVCAYLHTRIYIHIYIIMYITPIYNRLHANIYTGIYTYIHVPYAHPSCTPMSICIRYHIVTHTPYIIYINHIHTRAYIYIYIYNICTHIYTKHTGTHIYIHTSITLYIHTRICTYTPIYIIYPLRLTHNTLRKISIPPPLRNHTHKSFQSTTHSL